VAWAPVGVIASVLACILIGLAFSIYPARQAAALDPIAAIREE
jgi:putative ABC transport system permease protein